MIAIIVALCTSTGALTMFHGAQGRPVPRVSILAECSMLSRSVPLPILEIIVGPVKDRDGDQMWLVKVTDNLYSVTWGEPKAPGQPT